MTNLHTELREAISEALTIYRLAPFEGAEPLKERRASEKQIDKAADAIIDLFTHLISEAKPEKRQIEAGKFRATRNDIYNQALDKYEQRLLSIVRGDT